MTGPRRILEIKELSVSQRNKVELDGLSLVLDIGETLVVLGEPGSGKDALLRVVGNFLERHDVTFGTIQYGGGESWPVNRRGKPSIRIAYLSGPRVAPLNPCVSTVSQLARIVARKQDGPGSNGREELR
ncbi:MAG: hypothetical protein ACXWLO_05210, partial [Rhizomicrobium sp.]